MVYKAHLIVDVTGMPELIAVKTLKRKYLQLHAVNNFTTIYYAYSILIMIMISLTF